MMKKLLLILVFPLLIAGITLPSRDAEAKVYVSVGMPYFNFEGIIGRK